ncbi:MAG: MFS transporter [Pseudomonadota bacterium]
MIQGTKAEAAESTGAPQQALDRAAFIRARWSVSVLFFANGFAMGSWAPHIPLIKDKLALSEATLGGILFCMASGALLAMALSGWLCGRFGSRAVTIASGIALSVCILGPASAPIISLLVIGAILFGLSMGLMDVAMNAQAITVETGLDRPVFSSFHGFWSLGGLCGAGLAGLAFAAGVAPFTHIAAAGLAILVPTLWVRTYLLPDPPSDKPIGPRIVLPRGLILAIAMFAFLAMILEGAVLDWGAVFFTTNLGAGPDQAAFGYAVFAAAAAFGRFVGDGVVTRLGRTVVLRYSALLATIGMSMIAFAPGTTVAFAGCVIGGLGVANLVPLLFSAGGRAPGYSPADGVAAVAMLGYFGFLVGPVFIGLVADVTSLRVSFAILAAAMIVLPLTVGRVMASLDDGKVD